MAGERVRIVPDCLADITGNRSGAYNSEGASEVGRPRGPTRADAVHPRPLWSHHLRLSPRIRSRDHSAYQIFATIPPELVAGRVPLFFDNSTAFVAHPRAEP